jgi:CheY-like chemotaxis protein
VSRKAGERQFPSPQANWVLMHFTGDPLLRFQYNGRRKRGQIRSGTAGAPPLISEEEEGIMVEKKVLVCDDDEFVYFTVETYMKKMGYEVFQATNGQQALDLLKKHHPSIAFLDIHMPGMTGHEVCRHIKSSDRLKNTPVVFVSAKDVSGGYDEEIEAGGDYFVSKPFEPTDLAADLYFLADADFQPDISTLQNLRIAKPLALERAKKEAEKPSQVQAVDTVQAAEMEHQKPTEDPNLRALRMVVLGLARRVRELERLLERENVIPKGKLDEVMRSSLSSSAGVPPAGSAAPSAGEPPAEKPSGAKDTE